MQEIINKCRNLISDNYILASNTFEYLTSKIFTLTEGNIDATSLLCYKGGALWASSNYSYSATTGKVTVTGTLVLGNILEFNYNAYKKYSDNELRGYIRAAISYLSIEKYKTFTVRSDNVIFPTPREKEENLIAVIANILIDGSISQYRTPEITIFFNGKLSKEEKIKQTIRQFQKTLGVIKFALQNSDEPLPTEDQE